jgi:hypothetical protein
MAKGVVVRLEAVEIEQPEKQRALGRCAREAHLQVGHEAAPVPQAGKRIGKGGRAQASFRSSEAEYGKGQQQQGQ